MSFRGNLLRAGIDSDGKVVTIYRNDGRLDVATASAKATGTIRSANFTHTHTALTAGINEVFRAYLATEYRTGAWANAIVGRIDYGTTGDSAGGMAAAICGEINLPAKDMHNLGGGYYCFDAEIEIPDNCQLMHSNTTRPVAFFKCGLWGTDKGEFDDLGYLFHTDGLTAGATHCLSENSRTLRVNIEGTAKYIYLSDTEDDLGSMVVDTISVVMAGADGIVLTGTATDNAIEITGVPQGAGILIDYAIPTATSYALHIDCDTALAAGDVEGAVFALTNTAAGINNLRLVTADLTMGANCNGPYAMYARTTVGANQVGGLGAAFGLEIVLPSVAITTGEYHGMTLDVACTASSAIGAGKHSFIKFETWGNQTAEDAWDDGANLFFLNGMTSGAGNIVSANEQTLRVNIEGTSRYLFMSHYEDTLSIGLTGSKKTLVTTVPEISVWSTSVLTTGTQDVVKIDFTQTGVCASGYIKGVRVTMNTDVKTASSFRAVYAKLDYKTDGYTQGTGSCVCGEIVLPSTVPSPMYGAYACFEATINQPTAADLPLSFMRMYATGTAVASFRTNAYVFQLVGMGTATSGKIFQENTASDATHALRILIDNVNYYIMLTSAGA